ncbi:hypothetical protein FraQA3DRAFT_2626, partial [Frankia sp. QA3]
EDPPDAHAGPATFPGRLGGSPAAGMTGAHLGDPPPRGPATPAPAAPRAADGRIRMRRDSRPGSLRAVPIGGDPGPPFGAPPRDGFRAVRPDERQATGMTPTATGGAGAAGAHPRTRPVPVGGAGEGSLCVCGRSNPPGSRFCPCGEAVEAWAPAERDRQSAGSGEHHSPLVDYGEHRRFDREMRLAAGAWRGYDRPLAGRVTAMRTAAVGAVVAVALVFAGPWGGGCRGWVAERAAGILPHSYREIDVHSASVSRSPADAGRADPAGRPPLAAVDGFRNRAWATAWHADRPIDLTAPCAQTTGRSAKLILRFDEPVRIDRIAIRAGLDDADPARLNQARPKRVGVQLGEGNCKIVQLRDTADRQELDLHGRGVDYAAIWVVDAFPAPGGAGDVVAISELDFLTAR